MEIGRNKCGERRHSEKSASSIEIVFATGFSLIRRSGLGHAEVRNSTISSSKDISSSNNASWISRIASSMLWKVRGLGEAITLESKAERRTQVPTAGSKQAVMILIARETKMNEFARGTRNRYACFFAAKNAIKFPQHLRFILPNANICVRIDMLCCGRRTCTLALCDHSSP